MADLRDASVRLDLEGIHQYIRTNLGGTRFDVELDPQQIDASIGTALRECRKYLVGSFTLSIVEIVGHRKLTVADGVPAASFGITRFDALSVTAVDNSLIYNLSPWDLELRLGRSRLRPGELFEQVQHQRALRHVSGSAPDYKFVRMDSAVTPPGPSVTLFLVTGPMSVSIDFAVPITTYDTIPFEQEAVFLKLVEGRCKLILGTNRGKYGNVIQGPTGEIQTDAATQLAEGKVMWDEGIAQLKELAVPFPPIIG